jgi:uncharacterized membrane protein
MTSLILAAIAFVGTHFLLSHPLRAPIVGRVGAGPFLGLYSLVALATFVWMALAYRAAPPQSIAWGVGEIGWAVATVVMWLASVLLVGSLIGNPAAPDPTGAKRPPTEARGVYAITRHPMMWAFMIWGVVHILIWPTPANSVVAGAIVVLALFGSLAQDRKKQTLMGADWAGWQARTSWVPFAALAGGRARWSHAVPGIGVLLGGTALWLAASWAHIPGAGIPAGVWMWLG